MSSISRRAFIATAASGLAMSLAACSSSSDDATETAAADTTITVGASPSPHAEILAQVVDTLADQGYTLEVVEYSDYVQPNVALNDGDLDANFFQHQPYLDDYNAENGTDLVGVAPIHFEPMSVYGNGATLDAVPTGATIAVPSDATNEARALLLLEANGVITLPEDAGLSVTAQDIVDNPYDVEILEVEAAAVARQLEDVDFAVVNGNYALSAGLDTTAALATEAADSEAATTYANVVAARQDNADSDKVTAIVAALQSDEVKQYIEDTYAGTVVAVF